jgi:Uma2 family endonuclease
MSISYHDVERLQALYPNHQIELKEGKIVIMTPSDSASSIIGMRFGRFLDNWVDEHDLGQVLDASGGFRLPNGDLLSPDISFVSRGQLKHAPRTFLPLVPELVVEIKSSTDRVPEIREKIHIFLSQGVKVGILIDPDTHTVSIYRLGKNAESGQSMPLVITLKDGDTLTIPELFPGWEIAVSQIWPRVFD